MLSQGCRHSQGYNFIIIIIIIIIIIDWFEISINWFIPSLFILVRWNIKIPVLLFTALIVHQYMPLSWQGAFSDGGFPHIDSCTMGLDSHVISACSFWGHC
jgi:hypothetical protein